MGLHTASGQGGLARRRLTAVHIFFFVVSASAPFTVLGGGITTTYAVSGNLGVPLSFLVLALALGLFSVGYAAMSRYVSNAGAFYAYLANGLGRAWGVAASFVALLAYNGIQIGLYGLFGAVFGAFMQEKAGIKWQWWVWALIAMAVIGVLGLLRVDLNARVLAVLLIGEIIAVSLFDIGALTHPAAGHLSASGFLPSQLLGAGVGMLFAFGIAAFVGFESGAIYSEEARNPRRTVARATYAALTFVGLFYALSAWALLMGLGPDKTVETVAQQGPGAVFGLIAQHFGPLVTDISNVLFITSIFAALLSFHNAVARYIFALGRERVLPPALGRTGSGTGAPVAGSLLQTLTALIVVIIFVVAKRDPILELFTWLSGMAAIGVVLLMLGTSVAVIGYFRGRSVEESTWQRVIAPALGTLALGAILVTTVYRFADLLGPGAPKYLAWLLPTLIALSAVVGLLVGLVIRNTRPDVYAGIGRGAMEPTDEPQMERIGVR